MGAEQGGDTADAAHRESAASSRLDEILPRYHFRERHGRPVHAAPDRVYRAIWEVTPGEMPLVPLLLTLRSLPAILTGKEGLSGGHGTPLLRQMLAGHFTLLADDPGRELVLGVIGQMWKPAGGMVRVDDVAFPSFNRPGYVKVAMNLLLERHERGTWLSTETRILAADPGSRRRFALYWLVIRGGSGAIRRSWLRAVARRAERSMDVGA